MKCCYTLLLIGFLGGCAGRNANPVPIYRPGDEQRNCQAIVMELSQIEVEMQRLLPKTNKTVRNSALGAGGLFTLGATWLFMDFKGAEKIEFDALRNRYNYLVTLAVDKNCNLYGKEHLPTSNELRQGYRQTKQAGNDDRQYLGSYQPSIQSEGSTEALGSMPVVSYAFDAHSNKGVLSVDITGKGIETRNWVIKNIGQICSTKNIAIEAGKEKTLETGGRYKILNEQVKDNILTIEFEALW